MRIKEALDRVIEEELIHFEMPGHKGRIEEEIYKYDYTEIEGTDNLTSPQGAILETMEAISRAFGSKKSFISINGSTGGLLGAMSAAFKRGDEIIIMRGAHISIYDGIYLLGLRPRYLYNDRDYLAQLKELVNENTRGLVLTSPDYYGAILDEEIFQWIRARDLTLIVDEAHGSHLKLIDESLSSMAYADIVVHSFHKTLPSMTQSAVVHLCSERFSENYLQKHIKLFQSTSPNYLLMRSLDLALEIYESRGKKLMEDLLENCRAFKEELEKTTDFYVDYRGKRQDKTRLFISHKKEIDYGDLDKKLRARALQSEFFNQDGILLMPSIMNIKNDFDKLLEALQGLELIDKKKLGYKDFRPVRALEVGQAFLRQTRLVSFKEAVGRVVTEYAIPYPPGSPVLVPGEIMDKKLAAYLEDFQGEIVGLERPGYIGILED
ncbi:MAG: aminotransferase class I/II-fold pyridoxal phosphate-dependent enzyme [Tissierellia bacterium]|nr:aminotransferase class I/II-fold pyridoxal phosphate-dependent enzyme [Tissierellia bacterium]